MNRLVRLPYHYEVTGEPLRGSGARTYSVVDFMTVEIEEVTGKQPPCILSIHGADGRNAGFYVRNGVLLCYEVATPYCTMMDVVQRNVEEMDGTLNRRKNTQSYGAVSTFLPRSLAHPIVHPDHIHLRLRSVSRSTQDAALIEFHRKASTSVVWDRCLVVEAPHPRWAVHDTYDGWTVDIEWGYSSEPGARHFRIDRLPQAIAYARHLGGSGKVGSEARVLDDEAIRWECDEGASSICHLWYRLDRCFQLMFLQEVESLPRALTSFVEQIRYGVGDKRDVTARVRDLAWKLEQSEGPGMDEIRRFLDDHIWAADNLVDMRDAPSELEDFRI